jgi:uncharacterized membrane protein
MLLPMSVHTDAPTRNEVSARVRVAVSFVAGVCVAVATLLVVGGRLAPVAGWDGSAIVYLTWMWATIWRLDAGQTEARAMAEDPGQVVADVMLLSASVISLATVVIVLIDAGNSTGVTKDLLVGLGIGSVVLAWGMVHTVFTLRYARLYYGQPRGGIEFNQNEPPRYSDFAYLAFTIGMTFQVSDTNLKTEQIRATALRQGLLSYMFGTVIIATTINLIAGLTK